MEFNYNQLLDKIENKTRELSFSLQENKRVEFLDDFFQKFNKKAPHTLLNITVKELMLAFLLEIDRERNFDDLATEVDKFIGYFNSFSMDTVTTSCDLCDDFRRFVTVRKASIGLKSLLTFGNSLRKSFDTINSRNIDIFLNRVNESLQTDFKNCEEFFHFIDLTIFLRTINKGINLNLILIVADGEREKEKCKARLDAKLKMASSDSQKEEVKDNALLESKIIEMSQVKIIDNILKNLVDVKVFEDNFLNLFSYYSKLKSEVKIQTKKLYRYIKLKEILTRENKKDEITDIDTILDNVLDDDIKFLCLEYIYEHNMRYYKKLYDEYSYKDKNSISKYVNYFSTFGINFIMLEEDIKSKLLEIPLDVIKEKMRLLRSFDFSNDDKVIICSYADISVIEEINVFIKKGYIDFQMLSNNLSIYIDKKTLENLRRNINLLVQKKVNIRDLKNKTILLVDNSIIKVNVYLLESYLINISKIDDLTMLGRTDLSDFIASLVEIGLENCLSKQPALLNSDSNLAKRIVISEAVGDEIYENGLIKQSILDKDNFFVNDSEVNSYLLDRDNSNYHSNLLIAFYGGDASMFSYDIEGIKIPKVKVKNLSVSLENLVNGSLYTSNQVKILEKHSVEK